MSRPLTPAIKRAWPKIDKNGPVVPGMTTPCRFNLSKGHARQIAIGEIWKSNHEERSNQ